MRLNILNVVKTAFNIHKNIINIAKPHIFRGNLH